MNPPEQKEPEQKEPEQNQQEQKEPEEETIMNSLYQVEALLEQGETFICNSTDHHDNKFCITR